jgi:hypothetical protein
MIDLDLRLAALSKLMDNKSEAVEERLSEEFGRIEQSLRHSTEYDELAAALKTLAVLATRFHGAVFPLLRDFVKDVRARPLTESGRLLPISRLRYRSPEHLIREGIDATTSIRYLHTQDYLDFLLELASDEDPDVRSKARRALEAISEFDLDVFYGASLGAKPQTEVVAHISSLSDAELITKAEIVLPMLRNVLSSSMRGTSWAYRSVTISRGAVTGEAGIPAMRAAAIALLKRMYPLRCEAEYRKSVLRTLGSATRRERQAFDAGTSEMFQRDAIDVLHFLRDLVPAEALSLVQTIEHDGFWNYYHASSDAVREAALQIRDAVARNSEYQIYKQLIGFEGIFGDWTQLRSSEGAWDFTDEKRKEAARQLVEEIGGNYAEWLDRILRFSETASDDLAMFPVYYEFLELVGRRKPQLALELVTTHEKRMRRFLIPLARGLWSSARDVDIEGIVQGWIARGEHLSVVAKSLFDTPTRLALLDTVIERGVQVGHLPALVDAMGVAASLHGQGCVAAKAVFMHGLRELSKREDASWSNAVWFSRDFRSLVANMNATERAEVLNSMVALRELNYQAEQILFAVGEQDIRALLDYLARRLERERLIESGEQALVAASAEDQPFEAIPHHLDKLNRLLAKVPEEVLAMLRREFDRQDRSMFQYRSGARLIQTVFPEMAEPLPGLLRNLIQENAQDDIDFVLAVIRTYGGAAPVLDIAKAIIEVVSEMSPPWNEVAAALESTGVVTGEYGFVHALEERRQQVVSWTEHKNPRVRAFARWLIDALEQQIIEERRRADEGVALRKYMYGGDSEEI